MMRKISHLLFFLALVSGCGYTTRGFVYEQNKIVIAPVINNIDITSESRRYSEYRTFPLLLEKRLTDALVNRFNIDGHLKVVSDRNEALTLSSVITEYQKEALRYSDSDEVREQRLHLVVRIKLTNPEGKIIKEKDVIGQASFFLSGAQYKSESAAQEELIDDTTRRMVEAIIEDW